MSKTQAAIEKHVQQQQQQLQQKRICKRQTCARLHQALTMTRVRQLANLAVALRPQVEVPSGWAGEAAAAGLGVLPWRKSSEYFTLIRPHAQLAVDDTALDVLFTQHLCVDGEHEFRWAGPCTFPSVVPSDC